MEVWLSNTVRRRHRLIVVLGAVGAAVAAVLIGFRCHHSPAPILAMSVRGYTSWGELVIAKVELKNIGVGSVSYAAWGWEPYGWTRAQTTAGWTSDRLAPRFTGSLAMLAPGSNAIFSVTLPHGSSRWKCGFPVHASTLRERAIRSMLRIGLLDNSPKPVAVVCDWLVRFLLPYKEEPEQEFQSGIFEVGSDRVNDRVSHSMVHC